MKLWATDFLPLTDVIEDRSVGIKNVKIVEKERKSDE